MKEIGRKQGGAAPPCAACKLLRRRCAQDCIFSPHFPANEPQKFGNVHKVFGASNISKLLQEIPVQQRGDAVSSLVYEANARVRDPVYGCVGAISSLQRQIHALQAQLAIAQAQIVHLGISHAAYLAADASIDLGRNPQAVSPSTTGSSSMSSTRLIVPDVASIRSPFYNLDMIIDQSNMGEPPIWSC